MVQDKLNTELRLAAMIANSIKRGLPLTEKPSQLSLSALIFYSDAAGTSYYIVKGQRVFHDNTDRGVSCIGGSDIDNIWIWTRQSWPADLLTGKKDIRGKSFTTQEAVGMHCLSWLFRKKSERRIHFKIDNVAVMSRWTTVADLLRKTRQLLILIKNVHYLSKDSSSVSVHHVNRVSDNMATLADELSREKVRSCPQAARALARAKFRITSSFMLD